MLIRIGHTPCPGDAFMFWALLASNKVDVGEFEFEPRAEGIETLNLWARKGKLEVTALSVPAYPHVQERYVLLPHGASMGTGYGPVVISHRPLGREQLREVEIAVPGNTTTSFLVLQMYLGQDFRYRVVPAKGILDEVKSSRAEAGLVIGESQPTYRSAGLAKSLDIGEWWLLETGLPLPLTVNVARRDLGLHLPKLSNVIRDSILAGLGDRRRAMAYAMRFGRSSDAVITDRFVGMYVNELSFDFGDEGRQAIAELLKRAQAINAFERPVKIEFVA
ncbi:MAG: MqnA/MqnD/SBP family protein [Gaiellaceae bacterium]|jgi:1,4-dihydroxy-6-naphthoate synthase